MNKDILICGVGGQGTVLASRIIAAAAMEEGSPVHSAETIGMAQRGGSVTSHVRIGEAACSPLIPQGSAELILAFEPAEAVRNLAFLKPGGTVIVNTIPTRPVMESLHPTGYDGSQMITWLQTKCNCISVNADEVCAPFGSMKFFNLVLVGIAAGSGYLGFAKETLLNQIRRYVPARFLETDIQAFRAGFAIGEHEAAKDALQ